MTEKETMPSGMIINRETDGLHVNRYEEAFSKFNLDLNDEGVSAAVKKLVDEKINEYDTDEVKRQLLGTVELTTLKETDSQESVMKFTEKVNDFADAHPDLPHLATICVFPNYARIVADTLEADGVEIACVAGGFPASQTFLEVKTVETALAVRDGATEIDMVLSVGAFLSGDYETCSDEIQEIKAAAGEAPLKVILETGALKTALNIKKASILSIFNGQNLCKRHSGGCLRDVPDHPRILRANGHDDWLQGRWRRKHREGRPDLLHHRPRTSRRGIHQEGPLPHRHKPPCQPSGE